MPSSGRIRVASTMIAIADSGIVAWGVLALFSPVQLAPGFERYTGQRWPDLISTAPDTAAYVLLVFRLVGALNIAAGLLLVVLALTAFRARERWAWWTLLIGNTIVFGAPITYDVATGAIGFFEILEWFLLATVYLALAASWSQVAVGLHRSTSRGH